MARKKSSIVTVLVIVGILVLAGVIIYTISNSSGSGVSADLAKCIGAIHRSMFSLGASSVQSKKHYLETVINILTRQTAIRKITDDLQSNWYSKNTNLDH